MALWVATPQDIGFCAHHNGDLRCQCPYPPNTEEANGWLEGWDKAEGIEQYKEVAELVFPDVKGTCEGCGSTEYTLRELNLRPDQVNRCYACTAAMRYQRTLEE